MRKIHSVKVGELALDGKRIYIQSMLNVPSHDIEGNVRQAKELQKAGCEIVRVSVPDMKAVKLIDAIKSEISVPLVADIHFDVFGAVFLLIYLNVLRQVLTRSA